MARIKITLPSAFPFSTRIPVRITDINYGGHVGNDTILTIMHEARMQFLSHYGYSEMNFGGVGMIMTDAAIEFKSELFYGDIINALVAAGEISKVSFDFFYKLEKEVKEKSITVAIGKTGMACYDYEKKKIAMFPEKIKASFKS